MDLPSRGDVSGTLGTATTNTITIDSIIAEQNETIKQQALESLRNMPDIYKEFQQH